MGRREKQLDVTVEQAEDFIYLAGQVLEEERKLRMLRNIAGQHWLNEVERKTAEQMIARTTEEYIDLVRELTESVMTVVKNPLFWSPQIPLPFRSGFAVLLDAPLKPERVE